MQFGANALTLTHFCTLFGQTPISSYMWGTLPTVYVRVCVITPSGRGSDLEVLFHKTFPCLIFVCTLCILRNRVLLHICT